MLSRSYSCTRAGRTLPRGDLPAQRSSYVNLYPDYVNGATTGELHARSPAKRDIGHTLEGERRVAPWWNESRGLKLTSSCQSLALSDGRTHDRKSKE